MSLGLEQPFGLAQLQATFAEGLRYQKQAEACDIIGGRFSAEERLQIYRNNFVMSLTEVLQATYPMLREVLGDECFDALSREYILRSPPTEGNVSHYGNHFDELISQFQQVTDAAPYASDLARFEWVFDKAQQTFAQSDKLLLQPIEAIHSLTEQQHASVILHIHACVIPFSAAFALFDLQKAFSEQDFESLSLNNSQSGVIACDEYGRPWAKELNSKEFQLLMNLCNQIPLGKIPPEALTALPSLFALNIVAGFSLVNAH